MDYVNVGIKAKLVHLASALVNQEKARSIVAPLQRASGFWFGAGNVVEDDAGRFYLTGRYRNAGDSRTGLRAGERGLELAIFKSEDRGQTFAKVLSFSKNELGYDRRKVVSIEGSCLYFVEDGIELYVSTEKSGIPYPEGMEEFQKPGTGIWSIDVMKAPSIEKLKLQQPRSLIESTDPRFLHVKDPLLFNLPGGDTVCVFCFHPFTWASANTGYAIRPRGSKIFGAPGWGFFPRGYCWDVAISRITGVLRVPRIGAFSTLPPLSLYFYDGGESMRPYDEHPQAVRRPRGYSCEEIGGLALGTDKDFPHLERLSPYLPLFVSPYGTGSSRYVQILQTREGIFAFWQQSQKDFCQPLVGNFLGNKEVKRILS